MFSGAPFSTVAFSALSTVALAASAGSFSLSGSASNLKIDRSGQAGSYTLAGQDATFRVQHTLPSEAGAFSLSGNTPRFIVRRRIISDAGSYALTGKAAGFSRSRPASTGTFTLTGQAARISAARKIVGGTGAYTLTGKSAILSRAKFLIAARGQYVLGGQNAALTLALSQLGQNQVNTLTAPVNFKGELDANTVRTNDNLIATAFNAHDTNSAIHVQSGTYNARPVTAMPGAIYTATDKDATYFWTGTTWDQIWSGRRYGAWQDNTTQTTAGANTATLITFNTTDIPDGVSLVANSKLTAVYPGVYNLQWSGQFVNTDSQLHDATVWIRKNGTDVVGSAGQISVPNKHGSVNGHTIAAWNYFVNLAAGDYIQFYWGASNTTVSLSAISASSPYPAVASVIATMAKV